ncbi:hypothetical protein SAY87_005237 [Trapa incisa]|uniref:Mediator of RNA polymerase II transcription subunit 14 n=1 Tax=Trapa incisa TaxID=236973 RepID=A0AAN7K5T2_9MYRT|nr:hypothetical protein SAY87_005237 [Trapa incisa]
MHEGLQQARGPAYDVPSATQVLLTGNYQRLPKCIKDVGSQGVLDQEEQKPVIKKLDTLVRSKLLKVSIPKEVSTVKVYDDIVLLIVDGEFKVLVTLGYRGHLSLWRILHLELLVGEKGGSIKLEESRCHVLGDDLERRMAAAENPFLTLYSVLHEPCVALTMDTVIRQVKVLRLGRLKDIIRFDLIMDGQDLQIKCLHSTFVVDPSNGKEAEFSLEQKCIDVEKLLRAIFCNRYTCLLEIQKELCKNVHISRFVDDAKLQLLVGYLNVDYRKVLHGDNSAAIRIPESISNDSTMLLLGFPDCGSSYFLLM